MANVNLTLGPGLMLQGSNSGLQNLAITKRTASLTASTGDTVFTVTLAPGNYVTFFGSIAPSITSGGDVTVPSSVSLNNNQYVFTCTNNLDAGSAVCNFGVSVNVVRGSTTLKAQSLGDPSMVFYPPQ